LNANHISELKKVYEELFDGSSASNIEALRDFFLACGLGSHSQQWQHKGMT